MSTYTCIKCRVVVSGLSETPCGTYLSPCKKTEGNHVWIKITQMATRLKRRKR